MSRANTSVDYSAIQQCESKVDASFRRLRLARTKFKKNQSDAKETYLRKILDVHRKAEALERQNAYNKRFHLKRQLRQPLSASSSQREELDSQAKTPQQPIEEHPQEGNLSSSSDLPSINSPRSPTDSDWDSSPYKRSAAPSGQFSRRSALKKHLRKEDTKTVLRVDEDIQRDFTEGRISKGQYHKQLLFRNKMIYCMCLEDLDRQGGDKDFQTVEKERMEARKELQKEIARNPKAYASLHPRPKVTSSHAYSIAFRPHRQETQSRASTTKPPSRLDMSPEPEQKSSLSASRTSRQKFYVSTRPVTAGVSLGGGTALRSANPKHGGRLSSRNLVNYIMNTSTATHRSFRAPQPPAVRSAVQKARERVLEERCRSLPRGEDQRLKSLYHIARSRQSRVGSNSFVEVGLEIPSKLPSPRESEERSEGEIA